MRKNMIRTIASPQRLFSMLFVAALLFCGNGFSQEPDKKNETIKGTVVAENVWNRLMACYHVCGLTVLVRLDGREKPEYAVVAVSFMDDRHLAEKGPHWKLVEKASKWKFRAIKSDKAAILVEFANTQDLKGVDRTEGTKFRQWLPVKGAETENLPFGDLIRSYSVDIGKFESLKR